LVSKAFPDAGKFRKINEIPILQWELYDMEIDRTELNNLADKYPEIVSELSDKWQEWAVKTNTVPKPK
jgi:arylsulfatase